MIKGARPGQAHARERERERERERKRAKDGRQLKPRSKATDSC